ncbi:MAG: hypothetical protein HC834_10645 [Rhodospirillales bacterium]|nr:hypothetical protein [Rhodospirillales bacterium]
MPTQEWKLKTRKSPWTTGETMICGIGQGYVLSTPLQLAVMTARLASGLAVEPHITLQTDASGAPPTSVPPLTISPKHLQLIRDGLIEVVSRGTASRSAIRQRGFEMAGKTGTSQVRRITRAERRRGVIRNDQLPWEKRDHALFIGYAPFASPRYAAAVIVEHGGGGSKVAAPIARDVLLAVQSLAQERTFDAPAGREAGIPLPGGPT